VSPHRVGVLVMAHGTPASVEEIEPFYTSVRRGRPPTPAALEELVGRYRAIGGTSPLARRTEAQVAGLAAALDAIDPGRYQVAYGAKHTAPSIEDAAGELSAVCELVVGLVLTPHRAGRGSGEYLERAGQALASSGPSVRWQPVHHWYDAPGLAALLGDRVAAACRALELPPADISVIFSAHSVPVPAPGSDDPYQAQVEESAAMVAEAAGLGDEGMGVAVAWQSAGRTEQQWLGPDLGSVIDEVAANGRAGVVVCPIGFVSDHLEVLYDLDIEAAARAASRGLRFGRTESLNDDPRFLAILAGVVRAAAGSPSHG
jgi:protoporphyrin/coproporphyrin ferrochelatase